MKTENTIISHKKHVLTSPDRYGIVTGVTKYRSREVINMKQVNSFLNSMSEWKLITRNTI